MKKIKWRNVVKLILLIGASCEVAYISFMLLFGSLLTGNTCTLTWTGIASFIISCMVITCIDEDFRDQLKKTPKVRRQYK